MHAAACSLSKVSNDNGFISTESKSIGTYTKTSCVFVLGATAPDGIPWVKISASDSNAHVWVPFDELSEDAAPAKKRMRSAGIILFKENLAKALDLARNVNDFPPLSLISAPGWSGPHFALRSGEVFSPSKDEEPVILFEPDRTTCAAKGSKDWKRGVKRIAKGQPIVTFMLMVPFMGPILTLSRVRENAGFELSGAKGVGKSTLQQLATSVIGPALEPIGKNYWITANTTMNALETEMPRHADAVMVIEELSVMYAGATEKVRANQMREFVFRMAQGAGKERFKETAQQGARFVWITSTNDPIAALINKHGGDAAEAAGDRLLALPIGNNRKHGIFKAPLPKGCSTGEDAARAISNLVADNYGNPFRIFLQAIVKERSENEAGLKRKIDAFIVEFRDAVGVDGNIGSEARVADIFGLAYSAGRLAQSYGALPKKLDCLEAAIKCHRINRKSVGANISNVDRLIRLSKRKDVLILDNSNNTKSYRKSLAAAPALKLLGKKGSFELLLSPEQFKRAFPEGKSVMADPEVKKLMRHDKGRNTIKIQVTPKGKLTRYMCFNLFVKDGADPSGI